MIPGGRIAGYSYSRIDNPTTTAFAAAAVALKGRTPRAGQARGGLHSRHPVICRHLPPAGARQAETLDRDGHRLVLSHV